MFFSAGRDGSSPLTRGKRREADAARASHRLIPAHAGKTSRRARTRALASAHPRSRGENRRKLFHRGHEVGSSPLTRGKLAGAQGRRGGERLIPAHAGKTVVGTPAQRAAAAHPRSRGENSPDGSERRVYKGSSPLTRGKRLRGRLSRRSGRLIPAHAGKTCPTSGRTRVRTAHPRSRGENGGWCETPRGQVGSSPLTRGKPTQHAAVLEDVRLIPAHAGKTSRRACRSPPIWAHPRSRGENPKAPRRALPAPGSSPLTRGKLTGVMHIVEGFRLIPAHAGKTTRQWRP